MKMALSDRTILGMVVASLEKVLGDINVTTTTVDRENHRAQLLLQQVWESVFATRSMIEDHVNEVPANDEPVQAHDLLMNKGGSWLGTARHWIQTNAYNGDSVTWGSEDELRRGPLTVRDVEYLASIVAAAAINEERNGCR
jgi:hypothetical protein